MLSNDLLDIVIMNLPHEKSDNIFIEPIEKVEDIFVAKSDVFSKYKNRIFAMADLNELPLVLQQDSSTVRKFLNGICKKNHAELKPIYELDSYGLVLNFVREGLGIGFINKKHVIKEIKCGDLFEIKTSFEFPKREIGMAINKKSITNITINNFINILKREQK